MIETAIHVRADLSKGIKKTYLDALFATEDSKAHRFDVSLYMDNAPIDLPSGSTVSAYFIRYIDNGTVMIDGSIAGNVVSVTLGKACYTKGGAFAIVIKVLSGDEVTTVFYGEGSMYVSRTDVIIDTEHIIPSLDDLLAQIAAMEAGTTAANAAAANAQEKTTLANDAAARANDAAEGASGWNEATATVQTLEAGEDATVKLTTGAGGSKNLALGIPRGNPGVSIGPDEPTDPTIVVWIDSDGEADELPSGVTPEEIQAAVDSYLDANPVTPGATAEQAAQIEANKNAIAELQQSGTGTPGADGEDGGYYAPAVDTSGNLTWTPSKADMPAVSGANIKGPAGADGAAGADGYSPTISVTTITGGHRVTITDATGTKYFDVMDGAEGSGGSGSAGADGYSPTVTVTEIDGVHRVSITDVNGTKSFDVLDGADGAQGPQGPQGETGATGPAGADGYTPVRGTDYWTASDQEQIVSDVLAALPTWTGGAY